MSDQHGSSATEHFNKLIQFRQAAYYHFGNGRDALFELSDAVIQMRQIQSLAELSCAPAFRRKWSSVYEALQDSQPNREALLELYLKQIQDQERLLISGDHSAWERLWAVTLRGRSYQHQPSRVPGRRPVTIGHGYSTLAIIPESGGSWALPLLHERITDRKPVVKAAEQIDLVCQKLKVRPITVWDNEYGCSTFLAATQKVAADKLIRLRMNLCLEGVPKPRTRPRGPAPKHGQRFKFKDPATWWDPEQVEVYESGEFGPTTVRLWKGMRFRNALDIPFVVAQVERHQAPNTRRKPRILWFAWIGEQPPERWWELYGRRYPVEHWYRFAKGRLHWTVPKVSTPEQAERWSDLMPFITWELWLARKWIQDTPLPWQKPYPRLSPGRACQGMSNILVAIGTPTQVCKSRGKSPGWPTGLSRSKRQRYELDQSQRWTAFRSRQRAQKAQQKAKRGRPK
jgi:hypothetical protein